MQILTLKCTKIDFGWATPRPQTPLGHVTALPGPLAGFKGPASNEREGKGRQGNGETDERKGREERGGEGKGDPVADWECEKVATLARTESSGANVPI